MPRHATALFEFRKGRWHVEGKRLDEVRPDEAIGRNQRLRGGRRLAAASPPRRLTSDRSFQDLRVRRRSRSWMYSSRRTRPTAVFQQRTLAPLDLRAGGGQPVCDSMGDQADAVLVGVDQVAAVDLDAADHDGRAELDEPDVRVADARVEAEELEPQGVRPRPGRAGSRW